METVKSIIRNNRQKLNLTKAELAEKIGVNASTITRWESGEVDNMTRKNIIRLANVLCISPMNLLETDQDVMSLTEEPKIRRTFAHNLSVYLALRNRSQKELAKYVGVSGTTVTNWVREYKMPRMDKIDKICQFLTINRDDLLSEQNPPVSIETQNNFYLSEHEQTIIKKYRSLSPEVQVAIDAAIDASYQAQNAQSKIKSDKAI
ncbi:helix-turn-helix domain-containing protein [Megasphaera sp.]|uniref:helix-turn-helix domain-containing protein n=1 Tax=Megasphaera sp. TaxID=2023260 RepID=UPI003521A171